MTTPRSEIPLSDRPKRLLENVPLWLAGFVILLAVAAAMGPLLTSGFSYWDDESTISLNPDLNPPTWTGLAERWSRPHMHIYIPLTHTVWHVLALAAPKPAEGVIGNVVAWPFKLTNLLTHLTASLLVLMILRRLIGRGWVSLLAAMAFAVHPIQVESVAWTSGLKDLLFGMFSAGCILAYVGDEADAARPRGRMLVTAIVLLVLAALSKPTAMVVPAMLLVLDVIALRRPVGQSVARLVPFALVGIAFGAYAKYVQPVTLQSSQAPLPLRPIVVVDTIAFYLSKLLLPVNLAYDYGRTAAVALADARAAPFWIALKAIVVLAIIAAAWLARHRLPLVTVGLLWTALALGPVMGFTYFDFAVYSTVADHYAYVPLIGVSLVLAALLNRVRDRRAVTGCAALIVLLWSGLSFRQSLTWKTGRSMTERTLQINPRSAASWGNLALDELRNGRSDEALKHAEHAVELTPHDPQSLFVLSHVLHLRGDDERAMILVRKALRSSPYSAPYHHRLAALLGKAGQIEEALQELEKTLEIDPRYPNAAVELAQLRSYAARRAATQPATTPATQPLP